MLDHVVNTVSCISFLLISRVCPRSRAAKLTVLYVTRQVVKNINGSGRDAEGPANTQPVLSAPLPDNVSKSSRGLVIVPSGARRVRVPDTKRVTHV